MNYRILLFSGTIKVFTECHESSSLSIFTVLKLTVVGKTNLRNRRSVISIKSCGKVIFIILMKKEINWLIWITHFYDSIVWFISNDIDNTSIILRTINISLIVHQRLFNVVFGEISLWKSKDNRINVGRNEDWFFHA